MKLETILAMPDSKQKFLKLERALLKLQWHGQLFFKAKDEWHRLWNIYKEQKWTERSVIKNGEVSRFD